MRAALLQLVGTTSDHAWLRSAVWPPFPANDVCDVGHGGGDVGRSHGGGGGAAASPGGDQGPPKFRWWLSSTEGSLETPPDPRRWLSKAGLGCAYKDHLWNGTLRDAAECQARASPYQHFVETPCRTAAKSSVRLL